VARARRTGSFAYGIVLGTGILTIVSAPAVWLGLACCLAIGNAAWGAVYGVSFGTGRALVLHATLAGPARRHRAHARPRTQAQPEQPVLAVRGRRRPRADRPGARGARLT